MALRPTAAQIKGLSRTQKRGYAVQATVQKIVLDPSRPVGDIPLLFSKQGKRLRELQSEISLRTIADGTLGIHSVLANGGEAGLANLETAQKIAASPTLLASFKKDTALAKEATVAAIAWLKDIRSAKAANAAAAKIDSATQALLDHTVTFGEIVQVRDTLGLNISLTQKATVGDWWLAYAAAAKLRDSNSTYSKLTSVPLSADAEKTLHSASLDRVTRQVTADLRKFAEAKAGSLSPPIVFMAGTDLALPSFNEAAVSASIKAASSLIAEVASVPVNAHTVSEVFSTLMKARNTLLQVADILRVEADARQTLVDNSLLNASWATLLTTEKADKLAVEAAAAHITSHNSQANGLLSTAWDSVIAANLPSLFTSLESATTNLASAVAAIPAPLFTAELKRRETNGAETTPGWDQGYVRP